MTPISGPSAGRLTVVGEEGIVAYVSNGSWIDGNNMDGFRRCLAEEFSHIYCFNLRGNARTSGEQRRKEKGNVFGEGTRTNIAILFLVKKKNADKVNVISATATSVIPLTGNRNWTTISGFRQYREHEGASGETISPN